MVIPPLSAALPGFTLLTSDNSYDIDYQDNLFEHQMVKQLSAALPGFTRLTSYYLLKIIIEMMMSSVMRIRTMIMVWHDLCRLNFCGDGNPDNSEI